MHLSVVVDSDDAYNRLAQAVAGQDHGTGGDPVLSPSVGESRPTEPVVLAEIAELREENARLRSLLGLETRHDDGHRHGWAPTLFSQPTETALIEGTASVGEKLALLRSLFGARSDVFAIRWENSSTSKSGWSPAVRGGWANKRTK